MGSGYSYNVSERLSETTWKGETQVTKNAGCSNVSIVQRLGPKERKSEYRGRRDSIYAADNDEQGGSGVQGLSCRACV